MDSIKKKIQILQKYIVWPLYLTHLHTVVSSSKGPDDSSILSHSDGMRAATGYLPDPTDVLHQSGHVTAVTVAVTYTTGRQSENESETDRQNF